MVFSIDKWCILLNEENKNNKNNEDTSANAKKELEDNIETSKEDAGKPWDQVLYEMSDFSRAANIHNKCWNCKSNLKGNDWCEICRAPIKESVKQEVLSRHISASAIKCWRCGGTTSGNICGVCGSPLTAEGIKLLAEDVKQSTDLQSEKEPEFLLILSPKDRQLIKVAVKFADLEATIAKHFTIKRSALTNYGPEMIIERPIESKLYDTFEQEKLIVENNLRVLFRRIKIPSNEADLVAIRFFYWKHQKEVNRFSFKNIRWKLLTLALTVTTIILTGWFYTREVYELFSIEKSMAIDIIIFTFALLGISVMHELAHFIVQRVKKITLPLPFFLPIPPIPGFMSYFMLGTAGGFIRVLNPVHKRNDLFDLYFYGPLAGIVTSIVLLLIGLSSPYIAEIADLSQTTLDRIDEIHQFDPVMIIMIFFNWFGSATNLAPMINLETQVSFIHPLTYAAIVGLILNGLNYLPGSMLDGGFIFRSLFGERLTRALSFMTSLFLMFNFTTWGLGVLTMFVPRSLFQTPVTNEALQPHWSRYILGALAITIAVVCFPLPSFLFTA